MRRKIYTVIENADITNKSSTVYNIIMMAAIVASIIPLAFKENHTILQWIDYVTVTVFILDYILRLITADFQLGKSASSFLIYPLTPFAVIDLLSILPSVTIFNEGLKLLKIFRLLRTFKVLRTFKILRYSRNFEIISEVFKKQKKALTAVGAMAVGYVLVSALVIYNVEPQSFNTFFDAIYWATVSLTTVGYGDIYPVTTAGRLITIFSSVFGIAIVALPSGMITAGYLAEISKEDKK